MAVPDYETIMLPLLQSLADGKDRGTQETLEALAGFFHLADSDRRELLPNGRQPLFTNRVAWAKFYLKKASLIESPKRGMYHISERGRHVLSEKPPAIDTAYLNRFPDFRDFYTKSRTPVPAKGGDSSAATTSFPVLEDAMSSQQGVDKTPEELLELGYARVQATLASELLQRVKEGDPDFLEDLVVELLLRLGYGVRLSLLARPLSCSP